MFLLSIVVAIAGAYCLVLGCGLWRRIRPGCGSWAMARWGCDGTVICALGLTLFAVGAMMAGCRTRHSS